ncbi:MAG TPA: hypothetical protein VF678_11495, partial [bacterium]
FLTTDIVMLEEQAGEYALKNDLAGLREVEAELRFRKTERARRLLIEVMTWAGELERKQTQAQLDALAAKLEQAERRMQDAEARTAQSNGNRLYMEVGLDPRCPDFVLSAARRAFQKAYHPDVHAAPDAAKRFREFEAIFDRLEQSRKT